MGRRAEQSRREQTAAAGLVMRKRARGGREDGQTGRWRGVGGPHSAAERSSARRWEICAGAGGLRGQCSKTFCRASHLRCVLSTTVVCPRFFHGPSLSR